MRYKINKRKFYVYIQFLYCYFNCGLWIIRMSMVWEFVSNLGIQFYFIIIKLDLYVNKIS